VLAVGAGGAPPPAAIAEVLVPKPYK